MNARARAETNRIESKRTWSSSKPVCAPCSSLRGQIQTRYRCCRTVRSPVVGRRGGWAVCQPRGGGGAVCQPQEYRDMLNVTQLLNGHSCRMGTVVEWAPLLCKAALPNTTGCGQHCVLPTLVPTKVTEKTQPESQGKVQCAAATNKTPLDCTIRTGHVPLRFDSCLLSRLKVTRIEFKNRCKI
jgi:hypothetical protein